MFQQQAILISTAGYSFHFDDDEPQPILLVQSTGGGKSAVPQTCGLTVPGVTIVLENTQALGADQSSKLINVGNNNVTFHLDPIKSTNEQSYIIDTINAYIHHPIPRPPVSIFIFTSPEAIIDNVWFPTIKSIIEVNVLNLFCIDEVHQFVEFGTTFCSKFCDMATMLIGPMLTNASPGQNSSIHTKVPLLCMSATMNNSLFTTLQQILKLSFMDNNIYWSPIKDMQKRQQDKQLLKVHSSFYC